MNEGRSKKRAERALGFKNNRRTSWSRSAMGEHKAGQGSSLALFKRSLQTLRRGGGSGRERERGLSAVQKCTHVKTPKPTGSPRPPCPCLSVCLSVRVLRGVHGHHRLMSRLPSQFLPADGSAPPPSKKGCLRESPSVSRLPGSYSSMLSMRSKSWWCSSASDSRYRWRGGRRGRVSLANWQTGMVTG